MEAPQDVRVSFVDYQSVLLEWMGVYTTINEEPLEGYIVSIYVLLYILCGHICNCVQNIFSSISFNALIVFVWQRHNRRY